jgi:hypothetical protein
VPSAPRIEILFFDGCPNRAGTQELVENIAAELELGSNIELVEVVDFDAAQAMHFLGSPSVRVNGRDVEPGADDRTDFMFACRVYRAEDGLSGKPDELWIRNALEQASS